MACLLRLLSRNVQLFMLEVADKGAADVTLYTACLPEQLGSLVHLHVSKECLNDCNDSISVNMGASGSKPHHRHQAAATHSLNILSQMQQATHVMQRDLSTQQTCQRTVDCCPVPVGQC